MTTDPNDPKLKELKSDGQHAAHLVLSEEERAQGFARPVRNSYLHSGAGPFCGKPHTNADGTVSKCTGQPDHQDECVSWIIERFFERREKGCGGVTEMGSSIAETYARDPSFYDSTWCVRCQGYFPVGEFGEFVWDGTEEKVGT